MIENTPTIVDPFNTVEHPSDLRPTIVTKQHRQIVNQFHIKHTFRVLQHHLPNYKAINTYEIEDLASYVNNDMITQYRELFYYFNQRPNYCNLCEHQTDTPIEHHLSIICPHLNYFRYTYWNHARLKLSQIGSKVNRCHNQIFMQRVIEFCTDVRVNRDTLWKLICGTNCFNEKNAEFTYTHHDIDVSHPRNTFYKNIISNTHQYINLASRINNSSITIKYCTNKFSPIYDHNIIHHTRNDTIQDWYNYRHKIRPSDILIATDSSSENNRTGE